MEEEEKLIKIYKDLIERGIESASELYLITDINGLNLYILNDVIYARTCYRTYEKLMEE